MDTRLPPQVKRIGMDNVIYCRGHEIIIDSSPVKKCPNFAFTLSLKQSFQAGNYTFKSVVTDINLQQRFTTLSQQEVNSQLLPSINPYTVVREEIEGFNLKDASFFEMSILSNHVQEVIIAAFIGLTAIASCAYLVWKQSRVSRLIIRPVP